LQNIIDLNTNDATKATAALQGSNNNQIAVARILKAYWFSVLTDRYGDMPYSEALKQSIPNPKYDTQQSIYTDLFKELKEAVAQFDNGASPKGDILFSGNIARWKSFANSWRLILALRVSKADAALGKAEFNNALASSGGVLSATADNVDIAYPASSVAFSNPWFGISGDSNVSKTITDFVNNTADPRRLAFGNAVGGVLTGVPSGLQRQDAITYTSNNPNHSLVLNDAFRQANSTLSVITYADVLLARAEASELTWTAENADHVNRFIQSVKDSLRQIIKRSRFSRT
jgi:Starch-binding associating with outer membrane